MSKNNSRRMRFFFFITLTIIGCVLACSNIIPNDYLKLAAVMVSLCVGLYGIMRGLSNSDEESNLNTEQE